MKTVNETLKAMLTENTGRSLLDSGDYYGRHYDRNKNVDFDSLPSVTFDVDGENSHDICYTISTYHYLKNQLEFDDFTNEVNELIKQVREDKSTEEYPHWSGECVQYVYDNYDIGPLTTTINTYNSGGNLSQVVQYTSFKYDGEYYAFVQIHGGCDVRGGYTDAVCFKIESDCGALLSIENVYGTIDGVGVSNSYDGYNIGYDDLELSGGEAVPLKFEDGKCVSEIDLYLYEY